MRLPTRRSEKLKIHTDDGPLLLTPKGLEKLKLKLVDLEKIQLPQAILDVKITAEFGDFSENAEYQEAKHRLRRIHHQIFTIKEDLKRITLINESDGERVQLGCTVLVKTNEKEKTFQIVGPREADPTKGRLSYLSPLGKLFMGKTVGETTQLKTETVEATYLILKIN